MKRSKGISLIEMMVMIVIICFIIPIIAQAETLIFSTQISTLTAGPLAEAANVADINLARVKVKNIIINQNAAVEQTITIYDNYTSTTAATLIATWAIPGTVGIYYPLGQDSVSTTGGRNDIINLPYFAVRTSTDVTTAASYITVLYE